MILKGHALHTPEEAVARVVAEGPVRGQVGVAQVEHKEARVVARRQKGLHGSEVVAPPKAGADMAITRSVM